MNVVLDAVLAQEGQLAHLAVEKVRSADPRARCLDERRELLQAKADMVDGKRGGDVAPFKRKAG